MKSIRSKFIVVLALILLANIGIGYFVMNANGRINASLRTEPDSIISTITKTAELDGLSHDIRYLDEVLTQSARNYAFTGDVKWKKRYNEQSSVLDATIKEAALKGDANDKAIYSSIDLANVSLVAMEAQAFILADKGNYLAAQNILDSNEYLDQKLVYKNGIDTLVSTRHSGANSAIVESTNSLKLFNNNIIKINEMNGILIGGLVSMVVVSAIGLYAMVRYFILKPVSILSHVTKEITKGNFGQQVLTRSTTEIGDLTNNFNKMATKLKESILDTEQKVAERTAELEKLNHFMTGREIKMIELKQQLNDLEKQHEIKK